MIHFIYQCLLRNVSIICADPMGLCCMSIFFGRVETHPYKMYRANGSLLIENIVFLKPEMLL